EKTAITASRTKSPFTFDLCILLDLTNENEKIDQKVYARFTMVLNIQCEFIGFISSTASSNPI
ncbi:MAG: hypothetical protein ACO23V_07430, partial [Chitinophagaceae bacterium]